ncbi:MAG TPA: DNA replication/repair protein RecF [Oceanospirillales bacterium]|nr:DNA replication/repair protein RecF [Oceanospirillales bacterium]
MFITKLRIHDFRNIKNKEYCFNKNINIFYGKNGVGKTSILEAIQFLSSGKSFRKGNFRSLINNEADSLTVLLDFHNQEKQTTLSVSKDKKGKWQAKRNGNKILSQAEISQLFPVVAIDPDVYQLVDFGPLYRRNFLDWLVFHVEHEYLLLWKKVNKCGKQLNSLYKNKASLTEINLWEKTYIGFSEQLNNTRIKYFNKIKPRIQNLSLYMQQEIKNLSINYKQGWSEELSLAEQLKSDREKNLLYGQLQHGPHKMDIKINTGSIQASQTLSRGQKKVLSITFYMAYIDLLNSCSISPILCLDDFDAELDNEKLLKASDFFKDRETQIFITSVHQNKIQKAFPKAQMFHVEHC